MACMLLAPGLAWWEGGHAQTTRRALAEVPSEKDRIPLAEIRARFPQEKHGEFMRRAIANARKAGVTSRTGGAFGAVIVDGEGVVLADAKHYGNFDDDFIYRQFSVPRAERPIVEMTEVLRQEAVEVWREYAARPDRVDY